MHYSLSTLNTKTILYLINFASQGKCIVRNMCSQYSKCLNHAVCIGAGNENGTLKPYTLHISVITNYVLCMCINMRSVANQIN